MSELKLGERDHVAALVGPQEAEVAVCRIAPYSLPFTTKDSYPAA